MPKWTQIEVVRTAAANVLREYQVRAVQSWDEEVIDAYLANAGARQYASRTSAIALNVERRMSRSARTVEKQSFLRR